MRMARRHRGIASRKHGGNGTANYQRATNNGNFSSIQFNAVMVQQRQHGFCRAGSKALASPRKRGEQRGRRHGVDVLGGIECRGNCILLKPSGQRTKHQASVNSGVSIDALDSRQQLILRNIGRQQHATSFDAHLFAAFECTALVGQVVLALAHANDGQRRHNAALTQSRAASSELLSQRAGDGSTLQ